MTFFKWKKYVFKIIIKKTRVFGTSKITAIELRKMEGKVSLRRKVEGFFRSRSIHNSRLWSWRSNPFYSKYLPIRRELTPRRLYFFFFSFFEIFNQKPEFAECVYALRWLIIVNSYHHTSFRTFTIFPKISFRCSLESVKGLKKIESPFKSEIQLVQSKKKVKKQTNRLTTDDISDLPTPPLTLTPHPILELWPDFFGLTSAILCALLGYKLYGTWYFDQYYHRLCGMHWARVGPYHRWICKRLETDFGSGNVRFKTNFGSANVLKRTSDLQTF